MGAVKWTGGVEHWAEKGDSKSPQPNAAAPAAENQ